MRMRRRRRSSSGVSMPRATRKPWLQQSKRASSARPPLPLELVRVPTRRQQPLQRPWPATLRRLSAPRPNVLRRARKTRRQQVGVEAPRRARACPRAIAVCQSPPSNAHRLFCLLLPCPSLSGLQPRWAWAVLRRAWLPHLGPTLALTMCERQSGWSKRQRWRRMRTLTTLTSTLTTTKMACRRQSRRRHLPPSCPSTRRWWSSASNRTRANTS
mmetsp:Transcript_38415/g.56481  ORF Transcript_38415/g.56481 Transcript_38415/m.56481 type:complete len:214 (-) Transcript_38415:986-1627(-)